MEKGETGEQALVRECREELDIGIDVRSEAFSLIHNYPDLTVWLTLYNARINAGEPKLIEHTELAWVKPSEVSNYEFCPADEGILAVIGGWNEPFCRLSEHVDLKYRDFQAKLVPGADPQKIMGVRLPDIRTVAKQIKNTNAAAAFLHSLPHGYYDENMLHALMINEEKDYNTVIRLIDEFLPFVDNWAVCDTIKPKAFRKHRAELWKKIPEYIASERAFTVRFGIEMLMSHFLDADFKPEALDMVYDIESSEYYVQMMQAWYFATALAKQYRAAIPYLERGMKSETVRKMTVRKCMESFRIPDERKNYIKSLI